MEKNKRILIVAFLILLGIVVVVSIVGIIMLREKPIILQGHIEAQEIRISGMLAGHVVAFPVSEGEDVKRGLFCNLTVIGTGAGMMSRNAPVLRSTVYS